MKVLVVVDMQNDFIDGALGTKEAAAIVDCVREKVDQYSRCKDVVIYTRDTHTEDYLQTQEGRNLPVTHCVKGTPGWEIKENVYVEGCPVVDKPSFGSLALPEAVRRALGTCEGQLSGAEEDETEKCAAGTDAQNAQTGKKAGVQRLESIELAGLCTDICVISNAMILKAAFPETPISVDASCCAGVTPESHENALKAMRMCQIHIV